MSEHVVTRDSRPEVIDAMAVMSGLVGQGTEAVQALADRRDFERQVLTDHALLLRATIPQHPTDNRDELAAREMMTAAVALTEQMIATLSTNGLVTLRAMAARAEREVEVERPSEAPS